MTTCTCFETLAMEYPHLAALLRNDTIEIHNLETMERTQIEHLPPLLEPRLLSSAVTALDVVESRGSDKLRLVSVPLLARTLNGSIPEELTSGNTLAAPPITSSPSPRSPSSLSFSNGGRSLNGSGRRGHLRMARSLSWRAAVMRTTVRARIILGGKNAVQCLCLTPLVSQGEHLFSRADWERAQQLADAYWEQEQQDRARGRGEDRRVSKERCMFDNSILLAQLITYLPQSRELQYVYQRLGFHHLLATRFEAAQTCFTRGRLDPRLLVRLYPDIRGHLIDADDETMVFAGIEDEVRSRRSIDDIGECGQSQRLHGRLCPALALLS